MIERNKLRDDFRIEKNKDPNNPNDIGYYADWLENKIVNLNERLKQYENHPNAFADVVR